MTKHAIIRGTIILAMAALVTRVLGVAQRIPLQRILGDQGMATYGIAYNIYGILLIVATVGIPSALSKHIAEYHARGSYHEADQLYRAAVAFSLVAGVITSLFLYSAAPFYAVYISHDPEAVLAIRAISPALLLFPLISVMRGYFQGLQFMSPTGLSQVSEQILRVGAAVLLPLFLLHAGYSKQVAVAGASFGAVTGSIGAMGVMLYYFYKTRLDRNKEMANQASWESRSRRAIYRSLFKTAIPISLASTAIPLIYFIDSSTVIALLKGDLGYQGAKNMLGILTGRAQALAAIPPILAIALSSAVLPAIASAFSKREMEEVTRTAALALRLTLITGTPLALYLTFSAFAVNGFLFGDTEGSLVIAALCFGSLFQILMMTSLSILQGMGKTSVSMWYVFAGVLLKGVLNLLLASVLGIYGIILATTCGFILILFLNLREVGKGISSKIMGTRWKGFWLASGAMSILVTLVSVTGLSWLSEGLGFLRYGLVSLLSAMVGFIAYGCILYWKKGMDEDDLQHLPGRVQRLLGKVRLSGSKG